MSQNQQSLENLGAQPCQELPNTSGDTQRFSTNADERLQQSIFKDPHPPVPYHPLPAATTSLDHPQLSSYRYQVKQPQHLQSDGSTYAGARRGRSYLMSPKYLEYRDQQRRGTEEDGEPVWSDELEYAFKQALEANPPMGRGKSSERGISCSRNELIAEYIYKLTGKRRTSKQVSSHLQVLESFLKGHPDWERLVQEQLTGHSNSQIQPFAARWGASMDHLPSSHYSKHINVSYPAPLRMMPPSSRELPLPQCSFTPNLPDPHVSAAQCINFEMWVTSPNTLTRIDDAFHVYTHLQRDQRQAPMPLEELTNWRTSFPRLNSLLSDVNQPLNCEIILVEANLKLMDDFPPKGSKLGIFLELDMVNAMSGSALMTQQMENWMCYNYIYEYGRRTTEAWHSLPEPHTTKIRLPFESSWWAKTFTTLTEDKLEIEASRHHHAAGGCNRQYFRNLTVVQEIRASERASLGRLHNQYPMFPSGESKAMAVILWKFRQTRQNEVGATLWRTLIPSWGGTLARSSNAIRPPPLSSLDLAATSSPTPRLYQPHQTHALLQHTDPSQRPWPLYQPSHDHSSAGAFEFTNSNAKSELLSDKTNSASILNPFTSLQQQTTRQGTDVGGSSGPPAMLQIPDQPRPHTNLGTSGLGHESHLICPVDLGRILEGITDDVDVDEARLKCLRENDLRMESANQGTFSQDWHPGGSKDSSKDSSRAGDSVQTQEPTQNGAITDSGYASTRLDKNEYIQSASDIQHNLPTDPGYTSIEQLKTPQRQSSLQVDAARTIYSDTSSATTLQKESYISELADGLFTKRIFQILPELLRAFALKVGHNAPSQMHRDVMFFIHKNRA
ncbi:TEA/ATTS domain family-domain-containing protein [Aspergillus transmontanensis]|uniref:TEA/ATTS domain family-domain-containing protein n=1 Tax=Aspergillus transmontanensis TaxID=1034304 RepID=A0A5N6W363_9EURO|nr:TEA/ATTS domain family-domain-containing protein [Aspergillus transmontanensis]